MAELYFLKKTQLHLLRLLPDHPDLDHPPAPLEAGQPIPIPSLTHASQEDLHDVDVNAVVEHRNRVLERKRKGQEDAVADAEKRLQQTPAKEPAGKVAVVKGPPKAAPPQKTPAKKPRVTQTKVTQNKVAEAKVAEAKVAEA